MPKLESAIWYEIEIALRIGKICKNVNEAGAANYVDAITLGNDITVKVVLDKNQASKGPWATSKEPWWGDFNRSIWSNHRFPKYPKY